VFSPSERERSDWAAAGYLHTYTRMTNTNKIKNKIDQAADTAKAGVDKASADATAARETTGEKLKDAAHTAGEKIKDASHAAGEKLRDAGNAVKNAGKKVAHKID
jgi:hypothetical protein